MIHFILSIVEISFIILIIKIVISLYILFYHMIYIILSYTILCLFYSDFCKISVQLIACISDDKNSYCTTWKHLSNDQRLRTNQKRVKIVKFYCTKYDTKINSCCAMTSARVLRIFSVKDRPMNVPSMMIEISSAKSSHAYLRTWRMQRMVVNLLHLYMRYFVLEYKSCKSESQCTSSSVVLIVGSLTISAVENNFLERIVYSFADGTYCISVQMIILLKIKYSITQNYFFTS